MDFYKKAMAVVVLATGGVAHMLDMYLDNSVNSTSSYIQSRDMPSSGSAVNTTVCEEDRDPARGQRHILHVI